MNKLKQLETTMKHINNGRWQRNTKRYQNYRALHNKILKKCVQEMHLLQCLIRCKLIVISVVCRWKEEAKATLRNYF